MATIILTTGVPGSGKTYVRCARFLVDYFLLNSDGVHWSNFPLRREAIADAVYRRANFAKSGMLAKVTAPFRRKERHVCKEDILSRIQVIPSEELQRWKDEESGPWDFFQGVELTDAHIAIDEIHNYVSYEKSPRYIQKWVDFLAEVRHRGCTFEGLTQDFDQVHSALKGRAAVQIELIPCEDMRDPFFHIQMLDWYNLKAGFTGEFHKTVVEIESRKSKDSFKENNRRRFLITPDYFAFYDSYNKSLQEIEAEKAQLDQERMNFAAMHLEGDAAVLEEKRLASLGKAIAVEEAEADFVAPVVKSSERAPKYEFQRRTKLSLLSWFFLKNFWSLTSRFILAGVLFWLCFCGGMNSLITQFMGFTMSIAKSNGQKPSVSAPSKAGTRAGGVSAFPGAPSPAASADSSSVHDMIPKAEFDALQASKLSSDERVKALEAELVKLKAERLRSFRPVFFGNNEAQLYNGIRIKMGYVFEKGTGDYEGLKVVLVDPRDRCYHLSDGRIVRMWAWTSD